MGGRNLNANEVIHQGIAAYYYVQIFLGSAWFILFGFTAYHTAATWDEKWDLQNQEPGLLNFTLITISYTGFFLSVIIALVVKRIAHQQQREENTCSVKFASYLVFLCFFLAFAITTRLFVHSISYKYDYEEFGGWQIYMILSFVCWLSVWFLVMQRLNVIVFILSSAVVSHYFNLLFQNNEQQEI